MHYCWIMYYICQSWNVKEFTGYLVSRSCNHLYKHDLQNFRQTSCRRNIATWHDTWLVLIQRQNSILSANPKHAERKYTDWRPLFLKNYTYILVASKSITIQIKKNVVHLYNGIWLSHKKDICNTMDGPALPYYVQETCHMISLICEI